MFYQRIMSIAELQYGYDNEQVNNFVRFNIVRQNISNNMSHLLSASDGLICQNATREDLCKTVKP